MVPSGYPARTRLPGWPARLVSAGARSMPGMRRTNRFSSIPGIPTSASTRCARIGTSGLPSMGSLLPRARHPCRFSKQACRRATTLIALASCSSISCIAARGPLARTRAAPVIAGRCGCAAGGTSAAARWTAQPPQRCTPSPGPCPVLRRAITRVMPAFRTWAHEELARSWDKLSGWIDPSITKWRLPPGGRQDNQPTRRTALTSSSPAGLVGRTTSPDPTRLATKLAPN